MDAPRMRPTFDLALPATPQVVLAELKRGLQQADASVVGVVGRRAADLWIPPDQEHFWSPVLTLSLDEDEEGRWSMHGRFGPRGSVWTMFMAIYGLIAIAGTAALMWGVSQWMLDRPPWMLIGAPAAAALFGFVYGAVFIGQGLGSEQMYTLRTFVDHTIERVEEAAEPPPDSQG
jgi:hypothetical protein